MLERVSLANFEINSLQPFSTLTLIFAEWGLFEWGLDGKKLGNGLKIELEFGLLLKDVAHPTFKRRNHDVRASIC